MENELFCDCGPLQLTEHKDQTLLDQHRNRENPCKIKQFYSNLHWDNAAHLTINSIQHDSQPALIKPMENELLSDCGDLRINRTQRTNTTGPDQLTWKSLQHVVLSGSPWSQSTPHWKRQNPIFSCPSHPSK